MKLHNTLHRKVENFAPLKDKRVRIYTCGPTVYDHIHIGNLRSYIFADTLHRTLQATGFSVQRAMNYTDVDDKTIRRSHETYPNMPPREALKKLTTEYIDIFLKDMRQIGNEVDSLQFLPATDYIEQMKGLVSQLHQNGFAYVADDGVYFSIEAYKKSGKKYGQLLELSAENTSAARIQNDEYDKESVHDFALWKTAKPHEPAWEFTLDDHDLTGRPGWHIECSAMSQIALGQPFDIHTGGVDNIFPHHENEIAQSTAGQENPVMAQFFVHGEHLLVDGKKMAKSAQNFFKLDDILAKGYEPLAFRLLVLQAHYRSQLNFTWESLEAAQNRLNDYRAMADLRWQPQASERRLNRYAHFENLKRAMQNDLNSPEALALLSAVAADILEHGIHVDEQARLAEFLEHLDSLFGLALASREDISDEQKVLIKQREAARKAKNWAQSDALRDQLKQQGIGLRDRPFGAQWFRLESSPHA